MGTISSHRRHTDTRGIMKLAVLFAASVYAESDASAERTEADATALDALATADDDHILSQIKKGRHHHRFSISPLVVHAVKLRHHYHVCHKRFPLIHKRCNHKIHHLTKVYHHLRHRANKAVHIMKIWMKKFHHCNKFCWWRRHHKKGDEAVAAEDKEDRGDEEE